MSDFTMGATLTLTDNFSSTLTAAGHNAEAFKSQITGISSAMSSSTASMAETASAANGLGSGLQNVGSIADSMGSSMTDAVSGAESMADTIQEIAALEYAVDKGRINRNPGKKTRRPKSKPKTNNILTDEEMETLGIKGTKYRYYPAYMLTLTTACRRGEILGLDWQHVDIGIPWTTVDRYFPWGDIKKLPKWDTKALKTLLEDHNITLGDGYLRLVYQMVDDNGTPFRDELKTDLSRRSLMITEEMVLLLIFWRLTQNTEKRKATERGIEYNPDNLVFCTRKGTYIYPRNFTKMWSENLRSMGIDHKRFHDLRHTVATVMLEDGEAMNTVQEQLGHYDAGFTASRYGHVTAKMRNSAAVKLGERLEKVRNPEAEDEEDANSVKKEDTVIPFQEGRKLKSAACKIK